MIIIRVYKRFLMKAVTKCLSPYWKVLLFSYLLFCFNVFCSCFFVLFCFCSLSAANTHENSRCDRGSFFLSFLSKILSNFLSILKNNKSTYSAMKTLRSMCLSIIQSIYKCNYIVSGYDKEYDSTNRIIRKMHTKYMYTQQ